MAASLLVLWLRCGFTSRLAAVLDVNSFCAIPQADTGSALLRPVDHRSL